MKKSLVILSLVAGSVLVIGIVLAVLFCVRRDVTFDLGDLSVVTGLSGMTSFNATFSIPVVIKNENFFGVHLSGKLEGGLEKCHTTILVHGVLPSVDVAARKSTPTNVEGDLTYRALADTALCVAKEVAVRCADKSRGSLAMLLRVTVTYKTWAGHGIEEIKRNIDVNCSSLP